MKKNVLFLLVLSLFASLVVLLSSLPTAVEAAPADFTITATTQICCITTTTPTPTDFISPPITKSSDPGSRLPTTGELPPGPSGPGTLALAGAAVLLVTGLVVGFAAGSRLRKP